ncbi:AI-2E family transporter [Halorubrum sp. Eb13]|uniref:AI-2E family transporter n=1 Tax=Halorubrum sp. Eb13 TaxID=1383843 RepID=UPI000B98FF99|nr:AI-2E family transporter [Halorubrum sp. Eb13]OYR48141.1 AI-2E family transporter [Halorubrum sp. Eb13]
MILSRSRVLGALLVATAVIAAFVLAEVLRTVVFAITFAYVLYPLRKRLVGRGLSRRVACAASTVLAFLAAALLVVPLLYVLYRQRSRLIDLLGQIPDVLVVEALGLRFPIEAAPVVSAVRIALRDLALAITAAAPRLALELIVFTILVYGLLLRPDAVGTAVFKIVPPEYRDIPMRLHRRTRTTLYSIYILQAATAAATFVLALALFALLGYRSPVLLAVIAGVLQFVPVVGPSVLVVALGTGDLLIGETTRAILVVVFGLGVVSFVPDAVIRTQLADWTGKISPGLYLVGFVGGILTVGAVGIIVGPLVVSLLLEIIEMLSENEGTSTPVEPATGAPK